MDANSYEEVDGAGMCFGIARARFNEDITGRLLQSCRATLQSAGAAVEVVEVPGSMELPYAIDALVREGTHDAVIAIGAVIKGSTPHFDYISRSVTDALRDLSLSHRVPVIAGVITTLDRAQAEERSSDGPLNRGVEAAMVALEMARLRRERGWPRA